MKSKVTLAGRKSGDAVRIQAPMLVHNVSMVDVGATAQENDPFASLDLKPDRWKAYMDFDIVHTLPAVLGPVQEGFYCAYLPGIVAASHSSLLHQQMNLNHLVKQYAEGDENISKDRIVGCVVATYFPPTPMGGWKIGDDPEAAPSIRARAVIFKLADGVNRMIGDHQASRKTQSVSIETITTNSNLGIYVPSRGPDKIVPFMEADKDPEIFAALSFEPLKLGKVNGEQAVFVFGISGPVDFRGVGITPRPAEREAKIISFQAEVKAGRVVDRKTDDGGSLVAMAAAQVDQELVGRKVKFETTKSVGEIDKVWSEGEARLEHATWSMKATEDVPVLRVKLPNGRFTLQRLTPEFAGRII
jgi:hypothetical protein